MFKPRWDGSGYLINLNHKKRLKVLQDPQSSIYRTYEPENLNDLPYYNPIILHEELLAKNQNSHLRFAL